jgi:hypothetical protein
MRLWTNETWQEYNGEQRWAKLRVRRDDATGEDYFDVLVGKVGKEPHAHFGIALDQTLLFVDDRGQIRKIGRRVESRQKGLMDEGDSIVSTDVPELEQLILKLDVNTRTGEITVRDFGLREEQ